MSAQGAAVNAAFNALDTNHDGVISRAEFAAVVGGASVEEAACVNLGGSVNMVGATMPGTMMGGEQRILRGTMPGGGKMVTGMPSMEVVAELVATGMQIPMGMSMQEPVPTMTSLPVKTIPTPAVSGTQGAIISNMFVYDAGAHVYMDQIAMTPSPTVYAAPQVAQSIMSTTASSVDTEVQQASPVVTYSAPELTTAPITHAGPHTVVVAQPVYMQQPMTTAVVPPTIATSIAPLVSVAVQSMMQPSMMQPMEYSASQQAPIIMALPAHVAQESTIEVQQVMAPPIQEVIKEVLRIEIQKVEKIVEVPHIEYQERIVEVPQMQTREVVRHVPKIEIREVVKEVKKFQVQNVEKIVEVPQVQYIERIVEKPEVQIREVIKHVPRVQVQEVVKEVKRTKVETVEKIVEVPQVQTVERIVEVPHAPISVALQPVMTSSQARVIMAPPVYMLTSSMMMQELPVRTPPC